MTSLADTSHGVVCDREPGHTRHHPTCVVVPAHLTGFFTANRDEDPTEAALAVPARWTSDTVTVEPVGERAISPDRSTADVAVLETSPYRDPDSPRRRNRVDERLAVGRESLDGEDPLRSSDHPAQDNLGDAGDQTVALDEIPEGVTIDVTYVGEFAASVGDRLSRRQREAVAAAWDVGYYEVPREADVDAVAAELDCALSTASELLRRAESRLVADALDRSRSRCPGRVLPRGTSMR